MRGFSATLTGWAFLGPMFFFFVVFLVVPVVGTFWWSTRSGGLLGVTTNVGLKNYTTFPQQVDALTAVKNTLLTSRAVGSPTIVLGVLLALLMVRVGRGGGVYRFLIYFPTLVPGIVAGLIWLFLTNPDFGLFNTSCTPSGPNRSCGWERTRRCGRWPPLTSA